MSYMAVYRRLENKIMHFTKERQGCISAPRAATIIPFQEAAFGKEEGRDVDSWHML
jgi:hypothetical protein